MHALSRHVIPGYEIPALQVYIHHPRTTRYHYISSHLLTLVLQGPRQRTCYLGLALRSVLALHRTSIHTSYHGITSASTCGVLVIPAVGDHSPRY
jgi:hypothetical protein